MLNGEGARLYGGRWTPAGMRAVYAAESSSLAVLEVIVHLADPADFTPHRILALDVPDELIETPAGATSDPQSVGASVLSEHVAMRVPSVVNGLEHNIVLNPDHPDFAQITAGAIQTFVLDARLQIRVEGD